MILFISILLNIFFIYPRLKRHLNNFILYSCLVRYMDVKVSKLKTVYLYYMMLYRQRSGGCCTQVSPTEYILTHVINNRLTYIKFSTDTYECEIVTQPDA